MRLDRVILACDENKNFLEYFKSVSLAWKKIIQVKPTLFFIGKNKIRELNNFYGDIVIFDPIKGIPTSFQAQCIRLLAPCLYNDVSIISDMDMIPMSYNYFQKTIAPYDDDKFIIYRPFNMIPEGLNEELHTEQIPICYNAASGKTWKKIFNVNNMKDIYSTLKEWSALSSEWCADQKLLHKFINKHEHIKENCIYLGDDKTSFRRLDRKNKLSIRLNAVIGNFSKFSDFHVPRPYNEMPLTLDLIFKRLKINKP